VKRLTKSEIEARLLTGEELEWKDATKKKQNLKLATAKSRRLFEYLLASKVRAPTGLPLDFIKGLTTVVEAEDDPADKQTSTMTSISVSAWWLDSFKSEGFGGINIYGGPTFEYDFDGDSWLAEGPNGSGKSSIIGAIIWAMTGICPKDHLDITAEDQRPVYSVAGADETEKLVGNWPPIAAYPPSAEQLRTHPKVSVSLTFKNQDADKATVTRTLENGKVRTQSSEGFSVPPVLIDTGLRMPARLANIKFGEGANQLSTSVQRLTGLDDLIALGRLCEGLCNKAREYLAYQKKELATFKQDFERALGGVEYQRALIRAEQRQIMALKL
jgi:hypothetical protein